MVDKQLTYDALRILDFNADALGAIGAEMQFLGELAHAGKIARRPNPDLESETASPKFFSLHLSTLDKEVFKLREVENGYLVFRLPSYRQ